MQETTHDQHHVKHSLKDFTLTTPHAIIIGSVIIGLSIIAYGSIVRANGSTFPQTDPLPKILKTLGVNKNDFTQCVNSGVKAPLVAEAVEDGVKAGVEGTPTTFILREKDGVLYTVANISGAQDKNLFTQAIEQALSETDPSRYEIFKGREVDKQDVQEAAGPRNVYVVEYSDTECPFCIRLHPSLKEIRTEYADRISFVYRHFPLISIHPHAQKEAEMISCVGELEGAEAMYGFIDAIFDYKLQNNVAYLPWGN